MAQTQTNNDIPPVNMKNGCIIYEHPLNEQIRTYLRLENLFDSQLKFQSYDSSDCHIAALHNLLDILDCLDRGDLKAELLKHLEQQKNHFQQLKNNPYIDDLKLNKFLDTIDGFLSWINGYEGKFASELREDRFIQLINNRMRMPGGSCSFDVPELHYFLHTPYESRIIIFQQWFSNIKELYHCVKILLKLLRENTAFESIEAINGKFEKKLNQQKEPQLIRIKIQQESDFFPEISGSKHYVSVRLLKCIKHDIIAADKHCNFSMAIC